jgi:hypothetical protein
MTNELVTLPGRIRELWGGPFTPSLRVLAKELGVDHVYLYRLSTGEAKNPSASVLRKLGLKEATRLYTRTKTGT